MVYKGKSAIYTQLQFPTVFWQKNIIPALLLNSPEQFQLIVRLVSARQVGAQAESAAAAAAACASVREYVTSQVIRQSTPSPSPSSIAMFQKDEI
jgi:hypothetical protein